MSPPPAEPPAVELVGQSDLKDLLPLMRAYCSFYRCAPADEDLLAMSTTLIEDPEREGEQVLARDAAGTAVGFATVFWSWDTTEASRIGIMNDLYVEPSTRGSGLAERLIAAALERCSARGAARLEWQTGHENLRAQTVYDRVGGVREPYLIFTMPTSGPGDTVQRR
jgi:GNAT superfamily N-acetyltransferase